MDPLTGLVGLALLIGIWKTLFRTYHKTHSPGLRSEMRNIAGQIKSSK